MPRAKKIAEEPHDPRLDAYLSVDEDELERHRTFRPHTLNLKPKISQWLQSAKNSVGAVGPSKANKEQPEGEKKNFKRSVATASLDKKADDDVEDDDDDDEVDEKSEGNMMSIMSLLGMDYEKSVMAKKKKLNNYTDAVLEKHQAKVEKIMKNQWDKRTHLLDDFQRNTGDVLDQWEKDLQTLKDQETKMIKMFEQHIKSTQQVIQQESQRITALRKIQAAFSKAQEQMENKYKSEASSINAELRKELEQAHHKLTQENAKKALVKARQSLLQDF